MAEMKDFPVYLFTGFLESGKTKFIQETLEDRRFCNGEKTLLLVCEEGEEEYSPDQFADSCVYIRTVFSKSELTKENLELWAKEVRAERAVIEYNGMWMLDDLYNAMPDDWAVYQEFMFADSGTFLAYNANMRQLMFDKLKAPSWLCLIVFSRRWTRWSSIKLSAEHPAVQISPMKIPKAMLSMMILRILCRLT